ncbi:thiamine-phosphate kinase [Rhizorhabdus wittichii]|uniref:Thiamine-monophosphate kinase n=1 Tax=Rhizorhabdus wittichii TaxID=160791 RepID=A0A975D0K7_9SPHN|nr:thiamine-phosphate kinase [Rhizorhabdus wittichii]QTH20483.1 thiamine-phosphate kinase [Rhizorhabdus wittichii]
MSDEQRLIDRLRGLARHPGARGLADDAAVLPAPVGRDLVLTHDMLVEGVHYLPGDPAGDVAWKLLAVNLSDLAAKGAEPLGVLMGFGLTDAADWDAAFVDGLGRALDHFGVPLLGGDTVAQPAGAARVLGLTAIGQAPAGGVPDRRGAKAGDLLVLTGPVGDAGLGLRIARGEVEGPRRLLKAYRLPMPRLAEGRALAPLADAMADVSDGLLIDAARIAAASGLAVAIDLDAVPLSDEARVFGEDRAARLAAATAGDDYQLIAAVPPHAAAAAARHATVIGRFEAGSGLHLHDRDGPVPLPGTLGYEHRR